MPAIKINLVKQRDFDTTILGSVLRWSMAYGRYIIVCTEIIVLLSFIYRFSLDRKITDLTEEIAQKSAIIQANSEFENQFLNLQYRITEIDKLLVNNDLSVKIFNHIQEITPEGIQFTLFNYDKKQIHFSATANSNVSLQVFLNQLKNSPLLTKIDLISVSKSNTDTANTIFQIQADIKEPTKNITDNSKLNL